MIVEYISLIDLKKVFNKEKHIIYVSKDIKTDQVKAASHGATVAPVSPSQLLYLQSRGIDRNQSLRMLRSGFLQ